MYDFVFRADFAPTVRSPKPEARRIIWRIASVSSAFVIFAKKYGFWSSTFSIREIITHSEKLSTTRRGGFEEKFSSFSCSHPLPLPHLGSDAPCHCPAWPGNLMQEIIGSSPIWHDAVRGCDGKSTVFHMNCFQKFFRCNGRNRRFFKIFLVACYDIINASKCGRLNNNLQTHPFFHSAYKIHLLKSAELHSHQFYIGTFQKPFLQNHKKAGVWGGSRAKYLYTPLRVVCISGNYWHLRLWRIGIKKDYHTFSRGLRLVLFVRQGLLLH